MRLGSLRMWLVAAAAGVTPTAVWAHAGAGSASGFAHGFVHPVAGLDHVLAMVAVGLLAASLGGRALWAVPSAFVAIMAIGGAIGIQQLPLPFAELGIGLSVVALGLMVAAQIRWPVAAAAALVGLFAVFHGYAHGAELPAGASGLAYAAGFMAATALLHLSGIAMGIAMQRTGAGRWHRTAQWSGGAMAAAGVALLAGVI